MRTKLAITLSLIASACGEAERSPGGAGTPPPAPAKHAEEEPSVAGLLLAEADILARAGMGFQRRWLDWHFAGRPSQASPMEDRTGGVEGYEATGFDPSKLTAADQNELERIRAATASLPRERLAARYQSLVALHGNALADTTRTGSLRITDDGDHLVFIDSDSEQGAHAWRIPGGRRVGRMPMPTSEEPFSPSRALASGTVWYQWTPTPAGSVVGLWDLVADQPRWKHPVYERAASDTDGTVLAVSDDGRRIAVAYEKGVVVRDGASFRRIASVRGVTSASLIRRTLIEDDVLGTVEEESIDGRAAFSGDGTLLALLAVDQDRSRLRLVRASDGRPVRDHAVSVGDLSHLEVDRDGGRVVGYAPGTGKLAVWDARGEHVLDAGSPIDQVALSADGALALIARGARLELRDLATGTARWTVELSAPPELLALSAAAGLVAWWSAAELAVARLADGEPLASFAGHRSWPSEEVHRESFALATVLDDPSPPMFEAELRDPFREPEALDAELSPTYFAGLPRAQLAILPDLVEAHRGKPIKSGPAAAVVRAWRSGCDGWMEEDDPSYTPDKLQPVDHRNLEVIRREIARRGASSPEAVPTSTAFSGKPRPCR